MIKKLQNRFILISMLSILLVLTVIIGTINVLNYQKVVKDAEDILSILSENNGHFPKKLPPLDKNSLENRPSANRSEKRDPSEHTDTQQPSEPGAVHNRKFSPEMPYETRYFSVILDENGTIKSTDTGKIAAVDENTASDYASQIWKSGKITGFLSSYRYLREACPDGTRILFLDCSRTLATFRSFLLTSILVSALGLCSVLVLVFFFSRIVMKPISESYEKQRQFITDAGHEIKTPLTIIDANCEILELEYGTTEWSQSIQKQTARLLELTNSLIYLSRMEESKKHLQKIDFSISDLVEETIQSFQPLASAQEKSFSVNIKPLLSYYGDQSAIGQLVSILLDNAVKYSPPQSSIEVTVEQRGKNICLMVCNPARELAPEQFSHLFDRFYRTDASRNSETGGYGIGLSIARAVTDAHKGKIWAERRDEDSLLVTVLL